MPPTPPRAPQPRRHTPRIPPPLPASLHERNTAPARHPTAWLTPVVKEIPPLLAQKGQNTALFGVPGRRIFHGTPPPFTQGRFSFIPVTCLPHRRVTTGPARLHQYSRGTKLAQHAPSHNRRKKEAEARKQFEDANAITAELLKTMPERFIDELNKTVQGVWDDLKPTETQGKKKGQPKALPVFSIHADGLVLSVETWKNPRRVLNPLCTLQHGEIAPFWMHEAWLEAMRRIVDLLDTLTAAPAEALESQ